MALLAEGPVVTVEMLGLSSEPDRFWHAALRGPSQPSPAAASPPTSPMNGAEELPPDQIREALRQCNGNISRAANMLGVTRNRLRYGIEKHQLRHEKTPVRPPTAQAEARPIA